jgi:hypothetical protein
VYFYFLYNMYLEAFLIIKRMQLDIVINVKSSSCKVPVILVEF